MITDNNYQSILNDLKATIREGRLKAVYSVNTTLLSTYWQIGTVIAREENVAGWGKKTIENLSADLKAEFPDLKGLSPRNLRYMREFAKAYPTGLILREPLAKTSPDNNPEILQALLAKLSWYHHITLLDKIKGAAEREFYIRKTVDNGWSRNVMVHQIDSGLINRQGNVATNFKQTIAEGESERLQQIFKDPYNFEFVFLGETAKEKDLELALTNQLSNFLIELGQWFSFMGRQYRMVLGNNEYFYDLLFYHTKLKRYIVIDLKIGDFKPEYLGKMEFYLSLADDMLRDDIDGESVGLILCKTKDGLVAEYALRDSKKPIGIAQYNISQNLPDDIRGELPSIEEIEAKMEEELKELKRPAEKHFDLLKSKLHSLKKEEVKLQADHEILNQLFDKTLIPLFAKLIEQLAIFDELFLYARHYWLLAQTKIESLEELPIKWKSPDFLRPYCEGTFTYQLDALKKGGIETFTTSVTMHITMEAYWYGFKIINFNNHQPFLKKLYSQHLTEEDTQMICDTVADFLTSDIERRVNYINP